MTRRSLILNGLIVDFVLAGLSFGPSGHDLTFLFRQMGDWSCFVFIEEDIKRDRPGGQLFRCWCEMNVTPKFSDPRDLRAFTYSIASLESP